MALISVTARKRLRWLYGFGDHNNLSVKELGERKNPARLRAMRRAVFEFPKQVVGWEPKGNWQQLTQKQLGELAIMTGIALRCCGRGNASTPPERWHLSLSYRIYVGPGTHIFDGEFEMAFLYAVARTIVEHGHLVRQCPSPTCLRTFISDGRTRYCTPQCSQNVRTARLRRKKGTQKQKPNRPQGQFVVHDMMAFGDLINSAADE
jgi:hypothetical protein